MSFRKQLDKYYLPQCILAGSIKQSQLPILAERLQEGKTTVYVCENRVCKLPVYSVEETIKTLK